MVAARRPQNAQPDLDGDEPRRCGAQIDGFTATTHVSAMVQDQYSAQITRQLPAVQGAAAGTPFVAAKASKQALIGVLPKLGSSRTHARDAA
jgi:hypothetical protein